MWLYENYCSTKTKEGTRVISVCSGWLDVMRHRRNHYQIRRPPLLRAAPQLRSQHAPRSGQAPPHTVVSLAVAAPPVLELGAEAVDEGSLQKRVIRDVSSKIQQPSKGPLNAEVVLVDDLAGPYLSNMRSANTGSAASGGRKKWRKVALTACHGGAANPHRPRSWGRTTVRRHRRATQ